MGFTSFLKGLFTPAFLRRLGGAGLSALADGGLEALYNSNPATWTNKFPFIGTIDPLPPLDDWLIFGGSMATWLLAYWRGSTKIKEVGEGMTLYATGMILQKTIVRATAMMVPTSAAGLTAAQLAAARATAATQVGKTLVKAGYTPTKAVSLRNGRYTPTITAGLGYTPTA